MLSTVIDYFVSIKIYNASEIKKKLYLAVSLLSNLGLLFFFKYYNFFIGEVNSIFNNSFELHSYLLPVGISFYTFQTISYSIDVYKGEILPEKNFIKFATFVAFFPQLVAGPIERAKSLLFELGKKYEFNKFDFETGVRLITWGFFKKVVIADNISILSNHFYDNYQSANQISIIIGIVSFSIQIFCDFSGYSDIARGVARLLGVKLMNNFNMPYFAKSFSEFWNRWHISLSTWFRDYVYIPLGGNRGRRLIGYRNLFLTFLVSGVWHGANWTFVIWGIIHACLLIIEKFLKDREIHIFSRLNRALKMICVFSVITLTWIFFRSSSINMALDIIIKLFKSSSNSEYLFASYKSLIMQNIIFLIIMLVIQFFRERALLKKFYLLPINVQSILQIFGIIVILLFGAFDNAKFIYFDF